ncbi:MAG: ABC transporter permease [Planctomycetota bacterium]|jgi:ABC-type transport system involved in multi-copper enzyme maturation permease subunit
MTNVGHIALNTFREAAREKVLYIIFFFALCMVFASRAIGWISVGQQEQVVKHFSLAIISAFGALISVFVGTALIYKETDKRTIYTILSKPVHRFEFVLGKFFGLLGILFCIVFSMGALVCLFLWTVLDGTVDWIFLQAIVLVFFELMVVTSIAILFSTASSPILSAIFTFSAYLLGQVTQSFLDIVAFKPLTATERKIAAVDDLTRLLSANYELMAPLSKVLYAILPNLSHFALRNRVVYGPPLVEGEFLWAIVYALGYSATMLLLGVVAFTRKRF